MLFYETFILIFTFLLLNIPIFISLYKYVMKDLNPFAKITVCVLYWFFAFLTQELVPFIGVLILIFRVHRKSENETQLRDINIWSIGYIDIAFVAGAALVFKIVISQLNRLYINIIDVYLGISAKPQEIVGEFVDGELYYKVMLFVLVVVLAPFVEEYIFRYYIYDKLLLPRMPAVVAAIISSALFTLLHFNVSGIPTFLGLGLYCTFMYEKKGFYGAVITHVVSNLVTAAFLM
ncbi:MAG TPA: CPBP family intramembrane glutamic endopeptidase [Clostridia bacterium]|nr:CPBP family intramembrane glutamic endopeptidase [Clostridia bacterium]